MTTDKGATDERRATCVIHLRDPRTARGLSARRGIKYALDARGCGDNAGITPALGRTGSKLCKSLCGGWLLHSLLPGRSYLPVISRRESLFDFIVQQQYLLMIIANKRGFEAAESAFSPYHKKPLCNAKNGKCCLPDRYVS